MKNLLFASIFLISLISCNKKTEITKVTSVGKANSVLVVVDNDKWQNKTGDILRTVLAKSLVGFPQDEPRYNLTQVSKRNFNSMLKSTRTIISVDFTNKNSFKISKDIYAAPQVIITITAKNDDTLIELLNKHEKDIIDVIKASDIESIQKILLKKYWEPKTIQTFKDNGFGIKIPYAFLKVQDTLNYAYFRKDIPEGYQILQIYTIPISSEEDFNGENIIKYRNLKGKQFVPGELDGSYMKTEEVYFPIQYVNKTMLGRPTIETHGVWEMEVSSMAGPFLSYALLDKKSNRIIVVEGDVYAPNISKRDYLFELEALLKTLEIE